MNSRMKFGKLILLVALLLISVIGVRSQTSQWKTYAPPDRSFRILSPSGNAEELTSDAGDLRDWLFERGGKAYFFLDAEDKVSPFSLFVFDSKLSGLEELRKHDSWKNYIALMILGDDDAPEGLSDPTKVSVNGLKGEEYTCVDQSGGTPTFARGRIFDRGSEVYFLKFVAGPAKEKLTSVEANRFFDSFELTPKQRRVIPAPQPKKGDIEFTSSGTKPILTLKDANSPDISYDGGRLVVFPEVNLLEIYDVSTGKKLRTFGTGSRKYYELADAFWEGHISSDGKRILAFTGSGPKTFDIESGNLSRSFGDDLSCCGQRHDSGRYVSSDLRFVAHDVYSNQESTDGKRTFEIRVLDLQPEKPTAAAEFGEKNGASESWSSAVMSADGSLVAASRRDRQMNRGQTAVWERSTQHEIFTQPFEAIWFSLSADGKRLVTTRFVGDPDRDSEEPIAEVLKQRVGKLHKYLDTTSNYVTEMWDLSTGRRISEMATEFGTYKPWMRNPSLSPDGRYLITVGGKYILVWDADSGRLIAAQPSERDLGHAKFSDNGMFVVSHGEGEVVRVWRFDEIVRLAPIKRH